LTDNTALDPTDYSPYGVVAPVGAAVAAAARKSHRSTIPTRLVAAENIARGASNYGDA
jgi:hypothetical protein